MLKIFLTFVLERLKSFFFFVKKFLEPFLGALKIILYMSNFFCFRNPKKLFFYMLQYF